MQTTIFMDTEKFFDFLEKIENIEIIFNIFLNSKLKTNISNLGIKQNLQKFCLNVNFNFFINSENKLQKSFLEFEKNIKKHNKIQLIDFKNFCKFKKEFLKYGIIKKNYYIEY